MLVSIKELPDVKIDNLLDLFTISGSTEPLNIGLLPEPSQLSLGIASCVTLNNTNRFRGRFTAFQIQKQVAIANGFKWFGVSRNPPRQKLLHFLSQTPFEHPLDTFIDSTIQLRAWRAHTDITDSETRQRVSWFLVQVF
jgi:hypothetical protein